MPLERKHTHSSWVSWIMDYAIKVETQIIICQQQCYKNNLGKNIYLYQWAVKNKNKSFISFGNVYSWKFFASVMNWYPHCPYSLIPRSFGHRVYVESMTQETDSFQSSVERTEFETQPELMNMVLQHLNDLRNNGNISSSLPVQTYPAFYE